MAEAFAQLLLLLVIALITREAIAAIVSMIRRIIEYRQMDD
jgi:hypothetical protein